MSYRHLESPRQNRAEWSFPEGNIRIFDGFFPCEYDILAAIEAKCRAADRRGTS
jgi:hypothetical protein